jgi:integrase
MEADYTSGSRPRAASCGAGPIDLMAKRNSCRLESVRNTTLSVARAKYMEARKLLAESTDPMAQGRAEKTAKKAASENSFQSFAAKWMEHWHHEKSPRHVAYVKRRMEADILPALGARPIAEIEAPEIVAMVMAIEKRGAGVIARRALQTAAQIFRHGSANGPATF